MVKIIKEEKNYEKYIKYGAVAIVVLLVFFFFNPIAIVPAGNRGVLLEWGQVKSTLSEGFNLRMPIAQSVVLFDVKTQKYEADATAASKDLQDVSAKVALNFHVDPSRVGVIFKELGVDYTAKVISPALQESIKSSTAGYTAEELITKRSAVKDAIDNALKNRLMPYGIIIETISITDFKFSEQFTNAIEAKVTAEQQALQAKNVLERIKTEAEQKIASARAEAESLRLQNEQLAKSKDVLILRWIEKWNGVLPSALVTNGDSPVLLGLNTERLNASG